MRRYKKRKRFGRGKPSFLPKMLPELPVEVLLEVFLHMPAHCVVCVCRLVCREWRDIADSVSLWKKRCYREGHKPHDVSQQPTDWRLFYFLSRKKRNLLKNPIAEEALSGWQILENGGDGWIVRDTQVPHPDERVTKMFSTSFHLCRKCQLVDLVKEGYNPSLLDQYQPDIVVSDWYIPLREFGGIYEICVELLDREKTVLQRFSPGQFNLEKSSGVTWSQVSHVFSAYGPGVRYVSFVHGGEDVLYWAGCYGGCMVKSSVEIAPYSSHGELQRQAD